MRTPLTKGDNGKNMRAIGHISLSPLCTEILLSLLICHSPRFNSGYHEAIFKGSVSHHELRHTKTLSLPHETFTVNSQ